MADWLARWTRRTARFPRYGALARGRTCAPPADLVAQEASPGFTAMRQRLESELLEPARRPAEDAPLFVLLVAAGGGAITVPGASPGEPCLPIFSSYPRAADYRETRLHRMRDLRFLPYSAADLAKSLPQLQRGGGVGSFSLDSCPRCESSATFGADTIPGASDAVMMWAIFRAEEAARVDLYWRRAEESARRDDLDHARDLLLTLVGHVSLEETRAHLLLGKLGLRLGDRALAREARAFLEFLEEEAAAQELADAEHGGTVVI